MKSKKEAKEEMQNIYRDIAAILNSYSKDNTSEDYAHFFLSCVRDEADKIIANGHVVGANEAVVNMLANFFISEPDMKAVVMKALVVAEENKCEDINLHDCEELDETDLY